MTAAMEAGKIAVTSDANLVIDNDLIDVVIDATGVPAVGAEIGLRAMEHGKHLVMMNVEADVTIGAYLKSEADRLGVTYSLGAGDEPSSCMELIEFVSAMGHPIVAAGKGKNNPLNIDATPADYEEEAERRHMNVRMLVEFVDGSKTMVEMAAIANATGLVPDKPGMHGPAATLGELEQGAVSRRRMAACCREVGVVDYSIGKGVAPGVFVVADMSHPRISERMEDLKMGKGPYFTFHRPYHLTSLEVPLTCARVVLYGKADMVPLAKPVAEVCAVAKKDLKPGDTLDAIGEYCYRAWIMTAPEARAAKAIPCGLLQGGTVTAPIKKGELITYRQRGACDPARKIAELRARQDKLRLRSIGMAKPPGSAPTPKRSPTCPSLYRHLQRRAAEGGAAQDVSHPPLRGRRGGQLHARPDPRHDASFHRPGSERHGHLHAARRKTTRSPRRIAATATASPRAPTSEADVRRVLRQGRPATARAAAARCTSPTSSMGNLGANGIVAGGIPIAVGAALSAKKHEDRQGGRLLLRRRRQQRGRLPRGAEHGVDLEAAGDLRLREQRLRHVDLDRALDGGEEHRRPRRRLFDAGRDRRTATSSPRSPKPSHAAVERARAGEGPTLIECKTYRYRGHSKSDRNRYRTKEEIEDWISNRDPIALFEAELKEFGIVDEKGIEAIREAVRAEIAAGHRIRQRHSPSPETSDLETFVYTELA